VQGLLGIKKAISNLNPEVVRQLAERPLRVAVAASHAESYARIQSFLLGGLSEQRRRESIGFIYPAHQIPQGSADVTIYDECTLAPVHAAVFREGQSEQWIHALLARNDDLGTALARSFPPFRKPYIDRVISRTCKDNTWFALATALPDVIPNLIELPWALAEFASDTAFLTANQLRMAFLIAAASDREVGYRQQKSEIATVIAGAFGWRAIARELVGKIPFGGGLIAKAGVAYAGTKVVGISLEHLYSIGYTFSREERDAMYADALRQGREAAMRILSHLRPDVAAKYAAEVKKRFAATSGAA
jgi:hypothetical protein